ncbi:ABC transporter ATP-binding protein [Neobacillus sp. OS1-32]|jgi:putative ABC transport system ATP-binding protein|uniref:ABC transporter ATP-binding protein n=1 Tax=Neobacillus paridis TaxID=2803862 RepID=A0ABS1TKV8_9BACI|nr:MULTISPECIES: ABC transporter ATP-binding protein [Neobacillus]MBL4951389.1 ABC transporter ATP-binding protein [Neobacillus paridis]WML30695.1 ABC transporter ATP-binding protein [Neobacillus sp. OS1-32]
MIELKNVHKVFKNKYYSTEILTDVSFSVPTGSWTTIVGPSGSGKSTLLNIISGLLPPDSGNVSINGTNIYQLTDPERSELRRKEIGFVFQDFKLLPYYSILDNVILPLYYDRDKKQLYARAEELLNMVGISEALFSRLPEGLSGGEKQRVAIARSLIANPQMLICDEPTGNLDRENRDNIVDILLKLKNQGKTIVLVTHDMEIADRGDEVYRLINGTLTQSEVRV